MNIESRGSPGVRSAGLGLAATLLFGALAGVAVAREPVLVPVGVVALGLGVLGVARPDLLVGGMFIAMLLDRAGLTGMKLDQFPVTASKLAVVASLVLWTLHVGLTRVTALRWHPVLSALVGMVVATAVCIAWANSMKVGKFSLFGLAMMAVLVGLVHTVLAEVRLASLYRLMAFCLCVAIVVSGVRSSGAGEAARAAGTMGDPNEWATMVLLLTSVVLGGLAWDQSPWARPLRLGVLLLAPVAVIASGSRTATVVALLVFPGCAWLLWHRRGELLAGVTAAVLGAPLLVDPDLLLRRFSGVLQRFRGVSTARDASVEERSELFRQGVDLFRDNWLIGVGPGRFPIASGYVSETGTLRPAHNTYLEIASEQGLVGLIPTLIFGLTVLWTLRRGYHAASEPEDRARIAGVTLGLGCVAVMAATLGLLTFAMAWLMLGIGLAAVHQAERRGQGTGAGTAA